MPIDRFYWQNSERVLTLALIQTSRPFRIVSEQTDAEQGFATANYYSLLHQLGSYYIAINTVPKLNLLKSYFNFVN